MNMRLLGAPTLKDVVPEMVDASNLQSHIVAVPGDALYNNNCAFPFIESRRCRQLNFWADESMIYAKLKSSKAKL